MRKEHQGYRDLNARIANEAVRLGWSSRRARTEIRRLMTEMFCDSLSAVRLLEQGRISQVSLDEEAKEQGKGITPAASQSPPAASSSDP